VSGEDRDAPGMTSSSHDEPEAAWTAAYRRAPMSLRELLSHVGLTAAQLPFELDADSPFTVKAPPHFLSLIRKGDPHDPLLLQVLARADERLPGEAGGADPLAEAARFKTRGVIQKYRGRVLVLLSGACAIHCRYCFRRHYDYGPLILGGADLETLADLVEADPTVREVILSGGDPLSVTDRKIVALLDRLGAIPSLRVIRFHTRTVTTVPARVTPALVEALASSSKKIVVVTHANHPNEIDTVVGQSLHRLRDAGVTLLNQATLLRGVNDRAQILIDHSWTLFEAGVIPYYLHLLDRVDGADHFVVDRDDARRLQATLRAELPGYLAPRFVKEIPGAASKMPLDSLA
jgi:EF-P beta-lysylation protein EpmB